MVRITKTVIVTNKLPKKEAANLHNNLKVLRVKFNLNQTDMAKLLGINISTYCFKENGTSEFTITEVEKIRNYFNLPYEEIFFGSILKLANS